MIRGSIVLCLALVCSGPATAYERIITLSPHGAELVAAAGGAGRLVGVAAFTDLPESTGSLPLVGDSRALDRERVLALKPDLAIVWTGGNRESDIRWLEARGIALYRSHPRSLEDIPRDIREIGALLGTEHEAEANAVRTEAMIAGLRTQYAGAPVLKVFFQLWSRPPMTLGGSTLISRALDTCGLVNVFADVDRDAFSIDNETLFSLDADLELIPDDLGRLPPLTGAARSLHFAADGLYRPGPGMIETLIEVCNAARKNP